MGKTTEKITEEMKSKMISLYNEGKMDSEIAKVLGVSTSAILYWRKKLNLKSKFTYSKISKIDNVKFEELFNKGLSDYVIAKELNMSPDGVYSHRMRYHYLRNNDLRFNKAIELSDFQKQVLIGTVLGDSSLRVQSNTVNANPSLSCAHCVAQKEYCEYKTKIFENLGAKCNYHKRNIPDKRNGIYYEDYAMYVPANPEFLIYYQSFYKNGKKVIPFELLDNFTEVSLAFMYMDDGSKTNNTYSIATNCFSMEDLIKFKKFLYNKFNIETTIRKNHVLYIRICSKDIFTSLISPHFCECMKYKLNVS